MPIDDPASVYFGISKDTNDTVERSTQVFCGVRMLCARCHSHPMENWTQADYYGLASFFTQVSVRPDVRFPNVPNSKRVQIVRTAGFATNPRSGQAQPPKFLGGGESRNSPPAPTAARPTPAGSRPPKTPSSPAAWSIASGVTSSIAASSSPVDDVRSTNPPINPALLDALTRDFVEHRFDVRHLMRRIVTSATYQRSSEATASNRHDEQNFSHAIPRRVPAEALLDSLVQATGVPGRLRRRPGQFPGRPAARRRLARTHS